MATATKRRWDGNKGLTRILAPVGDLRPHPKNPRRGDVPAIVASLERFGQQRPILALPDGTIVAGHHVYYAAAELGWTHVAVVHSDLTDREVDAYLLADNRTADLGDYDPIALSGMLGEIIEQGSALLEGTGYTADDYLDLMREINEAAGTPPVEGSPPGPKLADMFGAPPFSVLDARAGYWQERKRAWAASGLLRSVGRGPVLVSSKERRDPAYYSRKQEAEKALGRPLTPTEYANLWTAPVGDGLTGTATSQFDPVLAEIAIAWFCPPGGSVLDPFAGGPTRGYVAAVLGRRYVGYDLSAEQVAANVEVASTLTVAHAPRWIVGDAADMDESPESHDLLLTCPPYYDLEKYQPDEPRDLSSMSTADFDRAHSAIIARAAAALRPDRFAVWVVGDARDRHGNFRNFIGKTVRAFEDAGMRLYNEAVLLTPAAAIAATAARPFITTRKLARTHQNVLVFVKGSAKAAAIATPLHDGLVRVDLET